MAKHLPTAPDPELAAGLARRFWNDPAVAEALRPTERLGIACSGGADSMALLWLAACRQRPDWAPAPVAMHVHHGLRGRAADADLRRVERIARQLGVPFRYRKLDPAKIRNPKGGSPEAAARRWRYGALRDMARRAACQAVATAHHEDDLAETLLMRLLRGAGLSGLGAFGIQGELMGLRVVRPLVGWPRADLRRLAQLAGVPFADDATNRAPDMTRNRIRHEALPLLERITDHPPAARRIARAARLLAREAEAVLRIAGQVYARHRIERAAPRRVGLSSEAFGLYDGALLPYLLRLLFLDATDQAYPPGQARLDELERFAREPRTSALLQSERNVVAWRAPDGALYLYLKPRRQMSREELVRIFKD